LKPLRLCPAIEGKPVFLGGLWKSPENLKWPANWATERAADCGMEWEVDVIAVLFASRAKTCFHSSLLFIESSSTTGWLGFCTICVFRAEILLASVW
jgi:hypothetical protein